MNAVETRRRWPAVVAVVAVLGASVAALARPVARWFETPPSYAAAVEDVAAGRLEQAEDKLERFLALHPNNRDANLVMARVELDRTNPKPGAALARLARVRGQDPRLRATVLTLRGKALYMQHRYAQAEACWDEALALHPTVAEAGWLLIQLYYLQNREDEARRLALKLSPIETDPVDRVRYLLELVREDVDRLAASGIIQWLEPVVKLNPKDRHSVLALGRALAKEGRTEEGLSLLRGLTDQAPADAASWEAYLDGLSNSGEIDTLARELARVPATLAEDPRLALYRGRVAQDRGDFAGAIESYEKALAARPHDTKVLYRLGRAYRLAKRVDNARRVEAVEASQAEGFKETEAAYKQLTESKTLGPVARTLLFQRLADLRERDGKTDEALAWHKQVVRDDPGNTVSARAVARLSAAH